MTQNDKNNGDDQELRNRIMDTARDEFHKYGFSKVTVDEIANKLGMSKKTIYKFFPSKEVLLQELVRRAMQETAVCCREFMDQQDTNFPEKLKQVMTFVGLQYAKMGRALFEDLQKHAPSVWKEIADFRRDSILREFSRLLEEGANHGFFRSDIDRELILMIYMNAQENIIKPEVLSQMSFSAVQVFETIVKILFEGILTDTARQQYQSSKSV